MQKKDKARYLTAGNFRVTVSQALKSDGGVHAFPLPLLSDAITSFSFEETPHNLEEEMTEDDIAALIEAGEEPEVDESGGTYFVCRLVIKVSYDVLTELYNSRPLPEDSEMVVRVEYLSGNAPVMYHEFRGAITDHLPVNGKKGEEGDLHMHLLMHCWEWSLFMKIGSTVPTNG